MRRAQSPVNEAPQRRLPRQHEKKWECAMEMPRHHRDEAQTCLELARLMIDPHAARILRAAAARYIVQATEFEAIEASPPSIPNSWVSTGR